MGGSSWEEMCASLLSSTNLCSLCICLGKFMSVGSMAGIWGDLTTMVL